MSDTPLITPPNMIALFMEAARHNFHNCGYINCCYCKYEKSHCCSNFVFSVSEDGRLLLMPEKDVKVLKGFLLTSEDYILSLSNRRFQDLYYSFLTQHSTDKSCLLISAYLNQH